MAQKSGFCFVYTTRLAPCLVRSPSIRLMNVSRTCLRFNSSKNFANEPPNFKLSSLAAVSDWIKTCWDGDKNLPVFIMNGNKITVLTKPQDFYQTLKVHRTNVL